MSTVRRVKMEVFGEEYEMTPEEAKEVKAWYAKVKDDKGLVCQGEG